MSNGELSVKRLWHACAHARRSADFQSAVSPICNPQGARWGSARENSETSRLLWLEQVANLRYGRLQICATRLALVEGGLAKAAKTWFLVENPQIWAWATPARTVFLHGTEEAIALAITEIEK
jgi:hypothetical protein